MTESDILDLLQNLEYTTDVRRDPDAFRQGRFRIGWRHGAEGTDCRKATLRELTWQNLGYRFGRQLGGRPAETVERVFEVLARQFQQSLTSFELSPSRFLLHFDRFCQALGTHKDASGPFTDFESGLAHVQEGYKRPLHWEARRRLAAEQWSASEIGTGTILERVIQAIEIDKGPTLLDLRNNLVKWNLRYGATSRSHRRLLEARNDLDATTHFERLFFALYRSQYPLRDTFGRLVKALGRRYDLLAYLFFLKDRNRFMPISTKAFEHAFDLLGIPLPLSGRCSWENYQGFLSRLDRVQACLKVIDVPRVHLLDAHSFCWMLAGLVERAKIPLVDGEPSISPWVPSAAPFPERKNSVASVEPQSVDFEQVHQIRQDVGARAEGIVLDAERRRLRDGGRGDLAEQVEDVSARPSLGYDIASFTLAGEPKPIEVKAVAHRGQALRFFLSKNEWTRSQELSNYTFALVEDVYDSSPTILEFQGADLPQGALRPVEYEVRLEDTRRASSGSKK